MSDRHTKFPEGAATGDGVGGSCPATAFPPSGKPYTRRKFRDWEVIACLIFQGVDVRCYRTGERITLENVKRLQKEHLIELALIAPEQRHLHDVPGNCRYSLAEAHAIVTNGTKATSVGSSKHKIAKMKRMDRINAGLRSRTRKGPPLKSGGFRQHPTLRRTMAGKVVRREP